MNALLKMQFKSIIDREPLFKDQIRETLDNLATKAVDQAIQIRDQYYSVLKESIELGKD
jgi:predicted P-loop ATPase/GTPase